MRNWNWNWRERELEGTRIVFSSWSWWAREELELRILFRWQVPVRWHDEELELEFRTGWCASMKNLNSRETRMQGKRTDAPA